MTITCHRRRHNVQVSSIEILNDEQLGRALSDWRNRVLRRRIPEAKINSHRVGKQKLRSITAVTSAKRMHFALFEERRVLAIATVEFAPTDSSMLLITRILGVEEGNWGPAHGSAVLEATYQFAAESNFRMHPGDLTPSGKQKFQSIFSELSAKYAPQSKALTN